MSRSAQRIRLRSWKRPTLGRRILRGCWNALRVVLLVGAAIGPAPPPPPPPPRPTAALIVSVAESAEEE